MYDIDIVDKEDFSTWILKTNIDTYISRETWIKNNILNVKEGNFPIFTFSIFSYVNDYNRRYGDIYHKYIINYCALLSFAKLSDGDAILKKHIFNLKINNDNSISVSLPTFSLVTKFKEIFNELYESKTKYTVELCKNLEDVFYKRYIIQEVDNDAYPIGFNFGDQYIIIHRSPLAMIYPSPFIFDENKRTELEDKLKHFYKKCHDNIEPISLENIDNMNLYELMRIIPITENKITYCFSQDTITKIDFNPLTRTPLTKETFEKIKHLEHGIMGFFDVGPVYGLFSSISENINLEKFVLNCLPKIVRIPVKKEHRELYGNLFLVSVLFSDETQSDLFEICLPTINLEKIDELKEYVNQLWNQGFFINDWQKELILTKGEKSFFILVNDPILVHAKDSIYDGEKALNYMRNILS